MSWVSNVKRDDDSDSEELELELDDSLSFWSSDDAVVLISLKLISLISVEKWTPSTRWVSLNFVTLRVVFDFFDFFFE